MWGRNLPFSIALAIGFIQQPVDYYRKRVIDVGLWVLTYPDWRLCSQWGSSVHDVKRYSYCLTSGLLGKQLALT